MLKKTVLLILLVCGVTFLFTYPVVTRLSSTIPVFYSTDEPYGVIWSFWWFKYAWVNGIPFEEVSLLAYPEGLTITLFPLWGHMARFLAFCSSEIIAYNILLLATYLLSAGGMFLLVFYLTGNAGASVFSSLIYAFCPFHSVRVWQHFGAAQIQWLPLYFLFLLRLWRFRDLTSALLLGVFFALNYYHDAHFAYFLAPITAVLYLYCIFQRDTGSREKRVFSAKLFLGIAFGIMLLLPVLLPFLSRVSQAAHSLSGGHAYNVAQRSFEDLFAQSARPLSYILPFTEQPLLGGITRMFIGSKLWGESLTEHNIFLGFIPLGLAIFSFRRRREIVEYYRAQGTDVRFAIKFFFALCITGWFFSQPPWWNILGFKLPMPSFFLYKLFPMVRAYVRIGVIVMLGVSVLAGLALSFFLSRFPGALKRRVVAAALLAAALFEFWYIPSDHIADLSRYPVVYDWLREEPSGIVIAEYPLDIEGPNERYKFYQTKHHKGMINGAFPMTAAHQVLMGLQKVSSDATAAALGKMGVRYVFLHLDEYERTDLSEEIADARRARINKGLKFIRVDGDIEVYEVITAAAHQ
ncbi:MAG: hypothetical protein PHR11_04845 [Candidatus Omnitrophica bacterium]|nr:hypothetical protein [Candidatus Omnitrophota bacterium]